MKCRALSAREVLAQGHPLCSPRSHPTPEVPISQRKGRASSGAFCLSGEAGNGRYLTDSGFWLKWARQRLRRAGGKVWGKLVVRNTGGKLVEAANSPCTLSWGNATLTLQISHCIKGAAFETTSRKLSSCSTPSCLTHPCILRVSQSCPQWPRTVPVPCCFF